MSAGQQSLKAALLSFLKNEDVKQPSITLDCQWSNSLKLVDSKHHSFVSKSFKSLLKADEKVPEAKTFTVTLSKWNFVVKGNRKGVKEVDLDVKKYSVKALSKGADLTKKTRDLLELADVKAKLEAGEPAASKKASVKKEKVRANEKIKEVHAEQKSTKSEERTNKKINKNNNNSGRSSAVKALKPAKSANKIADKGTPNKNAIQKDKAHALGAELPFVDVIRAKEFEGIDAQRSTTKMLRFQTSTGMSRVASPHQVNQESLHRLSSALGKAINEDGGFENILPESLKHGALNYKEFLVGRDKGFVSAKEIVFSKNAIDLFLKDFQKNSVDPYN